MKFKEYHEHTRDTAMYSGVGTGNWVALAYTALGLAGEAGEVANQVKKINRDDDEVLTDSRRAKLLSELGDVFWYLSRLMHEAGINPASVMGYNLQKLRRRQMNDTLHGDGEERQPFYGWSVSFVPEKGIYVGISIEREFFGEPDEEAVRNVVLDKYGSSTRISEVKRIGE
jgi:NTP pyrophosphatase (non-canonical NTP hydrolase)